MSYVATVDGRDLATDVPRRGEVAVDERVFRVDLRAIDGEYLYSLLLDDASYEVFVERRGGVYYVTIAGTRYAVDVEDARLKRLRAAGRLKHELSGISTVEAPMPGLVVRVLVEAGQEVAEDQGVAILEAMKMQNEVRSPRHGTVHRVDVRPGQTVNGGDALLVVGDGPAPAPSQDAT